MDDSRLGYETWENLAEAYAEKVETKAHNALYERPATLSLLPGLQGKRILDAGCGPGVYAKILLQQGAEVVAFDRSPKMVALAEKRVGEAALVLQADFEEPLDFASDEEFDIVLSSLALDYVEDWHPVFNEFFRVLKSGGTLVFSVGHPFGGYRRFREDTGYFQTEAKKEIWTGFGFEIEVPFYRRPLSAIVNPLIAAGFVLERILEPIPLEEFKRSDPQDYEKLIKEPGFLCVRAQKRPAIPMTNQR